MAQSFRCYRCRAPLSAHEWWLCLLCSREPADGQGAPVRQLAFGESERVPNRDWDGWSEPVEASGGGTRGRLAALAGAVQRLVDSALG